MPALIQDSNNKSQRRWERSGLTTAVSHEHNQIRNTQTMKNTD